MGSHPLQRSLWLLGAGIPAAVLALCLGALLAAVAVIPPPPAGAVSALSYTTCLTVATPIPDGDGTPLQSTLHLTTPLRLSHLRLALTATHPWPGDLSFVLAHAESGQAITLIHRPGVPATDYGCGSDDVGAIFDDAATQPAEDVCLPSPPAIGGTLYPAEPLATFEGQLLAGTWTLSARDHEPGQAGALDRWCLLATGVVPPLATLDPNRLDTVQAPEQTITRTLLVGNAGGETLSWQLGAADPAFVAPALSPTVVLSQDFDADPFPPAGWVISQTIVTPTWTATPHLPRGQVAQGGRTDTTWPLESWLLSPPLDLAGATLTFWSAGSTYWCRDGDNRCDLRIWLVPDAGDPIFVALVDPQWAGEFTWTRHEFDLDPLLPDGPVRVAFHYRGQESAVLLDDVQVTIPAPPPAPLCQIGGSIPWLAWSPSAGNNTPGAGTPVTLTLAATTLAEGTYTGTLCLESNDPISPGLTLPLTMTVDLCALDPAVPVPLAATRDGTDLLLQWEPHPANAAYEIHRSPSPFFRPDGATLLARLPPTAAAYRDEQALSLAPAAFYRVRALNCAGTLPADSAPAGFFTFSLP